MRAAGRLGADSRRRVPPAFALGFLAVLLPTLFVKHDHLVYLYRGELGAVLRWAVLQPSFAQVALYTCAFFARDVAEVFVLWAILSMLGRGLLRLPHGVVTAGGVLLALAVIGGNILSFRELGTFLSLDTLLISVEWIGRNPEILKAYLGWRNLIVIPIAAAWAAAPVLISSRIERRGGSGRMARLLSPAALGIAAAACAALCLVVRFEAFGGRLPFWGYWSSTTASLLEMQERGGSVVPLLDLDQLREEYRALAFPAGRGVETPPKESIDPAAERPRHVIVIALETASRAYYPILDNPEFPAFHNMQRNAITSTLHFTTRTSTTWSAYSILSGIYPPDRKAVKEYGDYEGDGLAAILAGRGYETTFIDSYNIDFHERDMKSRMWTEIGFQTLLDPDRFPPLPTRTLFEKHLVRDEHSFAAIRDAVLGAQGRGRKALVYLSTMLGHYEWKARPEDQGLSGREKIYKMCVEYDRMLGEVLRALEEAGLGNDLLVVVTGDHGLRNEAEFDSLGEPMMLGQASFNVPFLLYAPGVLAGETRLPYATSHVDLTPTLLELTGTPAGGYFFHGESLLHSALADRVVFLMNTGLNPTDGYYWKGRFFTYNSLSELSEVGRSASAGEPLSGPVSGDDLASIPGGLRAPKELLQRARANFASTARYFAEGRKSGRASSIIP